MTQRNHKRQTHLVERTRQGISGQSSSFLAVDSSNIKFYNGKSVISRQHRSKVDINSISDTQYSELLRTEESQLHTSRLPIKNRDELMYRAHRKTTRERSTSPQSLERNEVEQQKKHDYHMERHRKALGLTDRKDSESNSKGRQSLSHVRTKSLG